MEMLIRPGKSTNLCVFLSTDPLFTWNYGQNRSFHFFDIIQFLCLLF